MKRIVVGALPIDLPSNKIWICTARKHKSKWIFPKGGLEKEETHEEGALREMYEEIGLQGHILHFLGTIDTPNAAYNWFLVQVDNILSEWPEMLERKRELVRKMYRCTYIPLLTVQVDIQRASTLVSEKAIMKDALELYLKHLHSQ